MKLIRPTKEYKELIKLYKQEFLDNNEIIHGSAGLAEYDDINEWINNIKKNSNERTVTEGLVSSTTLIAIHEGKMVGIIDIRHRLNDYLLNYGGNIGYSISKSFRNNGYGTKMLSLALEECKKINLDKVLITCDKDNIASAKVIKNNGGILENEINDGDKLTQRYWINIKSYE